MSDSWAKVWKRCAQMLHWRLDCEKWGHRDAVRACNDMQDKRNRLLINIGHLNDEVERLNDLNDTLLEEIDDRDDAESKNTRMILDLCDERDILEYRLDEEARKSQEKWWLEHDRAEAWKSLAQGADSIIRGNIRKDLEGDFRGLARLKQEALKLEEE